MTAGVVWRPGCCDGGTSVVDVGLGADFIGGIESDLIRVESFSGNGAGTAFDARTTLLLGCFDCFDFTQQALGGLLVDPVIHL